MSDSHKWEYLANLDEQLLQGGVILSEWATFLVDNADTAFAGGAHLASIITGLAGVETHLCGESGTSKTRLVDLIEESDLDTELKQELQTLRRYRNSWVHVADPWDDESLLGCASQSYLCESMGMRVPSNALQQTLVPRTADGLRWIVTGERSDRNAT